jgi:hypothetical protein
LQVKLTPLPHGDGTEYYLQPVQQRPEQSSTGAPPLPVKPWNKPPDAKPPSPPRRKSVGDSLRGLGTPAKVTICSYTGPQQKVLPFVKRTAVQSGH